jgi:hypothetical protein
MVFLLKGHCYFTIRRTVTGYGGNNVLMTPKTRSTHAPGRPLTAWLEQTAQGAQVLATVKQLLALEDLVKRELPNALAARVKVASVNRQHLTLAVPGAAYASKLRQLVPSITLAANQAGWNLNGISVRIQANLANGRTKESEPRQVNALDETGLQAFSQLRGKVRPGPLLDAIERLLIHHGG